MVYKRVEFYIKVQCKQYLKPHTIVHCFSKKLYNGLCHLVAA